MNFAVKKKNMQLITHIVDNVLNKVSQSNITIETAIKEPKCDPELCEIELDELNVWRRDELFADSLYSLNPLLPLKSLL